VSGDNVREGDLRGAKLKSSAGDDSELSISGGAEKEARHERRPEIDAGDQVSEGKVEKPG